MNPENGPDPQEVINRLGERWAGNAGKPAVECRVGREPATRRAGPCSVCTVRMEFEFDDEVTRLVGQKTFDKTSACPYRVFSSHLLTGLTLRPEAVRSRAGKSRRIDPVHELERALERVDAVLSTTTSTPEDIEALVGEEGDLKVLQLAAAAQRNLQAALELVQRLVVEEPAPSPRGRTGRLEVQAIAGAMVRAWLELTDQLPSKDNISCQNLLSSAVATVFGYLEDEPNWEAAIQTARQRIKKDLASRS
jgi:hypothetical protein